MVQGKKLCPFVTSICVAFYLQAALRPLLRERLRAELTHIMCSPSQILISLSMQQVRVIYCTETVGGGEYRLIIVGKDYVRVGKRHEWI